MVKNIGIWKENFAVQWRETRRYTDPIIENSNGFLRNALEALMILMTVTHHAFVSYWRKLWSSSLLVFNKLRKQ